MRDARDGSDSCASFSEVRLGHSSSKSRAWIRVDERAYTVADGLRWLDLDPDIRIIRVEQQLGRNRRTKRLQTSAVKRHPY